MVFMRNTKKILATLMAAALTAVSTASIPGFADTENRDKVYDSSLVLDENIANIKLTIDKYLTDNNIKAYTALGQNRSKVSVIAESFDTLEPVIAFVNESGLDESLIEYGVDTFEVTGFIRNLRGDANCDGQLDMADVVLVMQALSNPNKYGENGTAEVHLTEQGRKNADMDGDGLTVGDAQSIQMSLLGQTAGKTDAASLLGLKNSKAATVKITHNPPWYDLTLTGDKAQAVIDYLSSLNLSDENTETAGQTNGGMWDIKIEYENNETVRIVHSGNKFICNSEMSWYSMVYDEAEKFSDLVYELSKSDSVKYETAVDWHVNDLVSNYWDICRDPGYSAVITSTGELKNYLGKVLNENDIAAYLEKYSDSFFKDKVLLIDSVYQSAGTEAEYKIDNVDISDEKISVSVKDTFESGVALAAVVSVCIAQVSVPKDAYKSQTVDWSIVGNSQSITEDTPSVRLDNTVSVKASEGKVTDEKFAGAEMKFGIDLLKKSFDPTKKGEENLLISPVSVSTALSMTANGADGNTRKEMEKLLGNGLTLDQLNEYMAYYISKLPKNEKEKVYLADSIWFKDIPSFKVYDDFLGTNKKYYNAELYKAPFTETTENEINSWVNKNTNGMIPSLLEKGDLAPKSNEEILMMLINTLYFEADWESPYDYSMNGFFTDMNGERRNIKTMSSREYEYFDLGDADAFKKPYAGGRYSFVGILPREDDIVKYVNSLDGEKLLEDLRQCEDPDTVELHAVIPKFEYSYDKTLNTILSDLGMPTAFNASKADFSKINDLSVDGASKLWISKVMHKTKIEVTETGTKAAAVTGVAMAGGAMPPKDKKRVVIPLTRPFVYMIVDNNNVPLFIGAATELGEK